MMMEDRLVRDLPEKSEVSLDDKMLVEDIDGTKLAPVSSLRDMVMDKLIFENVEEMKSSSIDCDSFCMTLGYRKAGDGGGAYYKIVYQPTAIDDGGNYLYLHTSDVNRAKLISMDGSITPEQFGAYGDGTHDDSAVIAKCLKTDYETKFVTGKRYLISSPIEIPDKEYVYIDLNGCTLEAPPSAPEYGINGLLKASTESTLDNASLVIKNGCIDMKGSAGSPILINKSFKKVILENVSIINATLTCVIHGAMDTVINNCAFVYKPGSNVPAVSIGVGSVQHLSQIANIKNTLMQDCSGVILVDSTTRPHPVTTLNIDSCKVYMPLGNRSYSFITTNYIPSSISSKPYFINISNVSSYGLRSLVSTNKYQAVISIKDITMDYYKNLFTSDNPEATIVLEGTICLIGDSSTHDIYPVFPKGSGTIHINTRAIMKDDYHSEVETTTNNVIGSQNKSFRGLYGYDYTIYDNTNIETADDVYTTNPSGILSVSWFMNYILHITDDVHDISPGMNNQIIGLMLNDEYSYCYIFESDTITIKRNGIATKDHGFRDRVCLAGSKCESKDYPDILYFKYQTHDRKWHQI